MSDGDEIVEVIDFLLDVSNTMGRRRVRGESGEQSKFEFIKASLERDIEPLLRTGVAWGLKFFGGDCAESQIKTIEPALRPASDLKLLLGESPSPWGQTPLAAALRRSFHDLKSFPRASKKIIVFTDGIESCEPSNAVDEISLEIIKHNIAQYRRPLSIFSLTVGPIKAEGRQALQTVTALTGGEAFEISSKGDGTTLEQSFKETFKAAIMTPSAAAPQHGMSRDDSKLFKIPLRWYFMLTMIMVMHVLTLILLGYLVLSLTTLMKQ
jgi:hypothetical protein